MEGAPSIKGLLAEDSEELLKELPRNKDGEDHPRGTSFRRGEEGWRARKFLKERRGRMARNLLDARKFLASRMPSQETILLYGFNNPTQTGQNPLCCGSLLHSPQRSVSNGFLDRNIPPPAPGNLQASSDARIRRLEEACRTDVAIILSL